MVINFEGSGYYRAFSLLLKFEGKISGKERQLAGGARQLVSATAPVMNESFSLKELNSLSWILLKIEQKMDLFI